MKNLVVIYSEYFPVIDALKSYFPQYSVDCFRIDEFVDKDIKADLFVALNGVKPFDENTVSVHYSLLPAFDEDNPVEKAVLAGVKVTGITFSYLKTKQIVAQYPLIIDSSMHFDEITRQLQYIEQMLLPRVIEKFINNEQFDIKNLMNKNGCGGCKGCSH